MGMMSWELPISRFHFIIAIYKSFNRENMIWNFNKINDKMYTKTERIDN